MPYARHGLTIILLTLLCLPILLVGAFQTVKNKRSDIFDWLPGDYPSTATYNWFREHFHGDQFILASWEGCDIDDPRLPLLVQSVIQRDNALGPQERFHEAITGVGLADRFKALGDQHELDLEKFKGTLIGPDGKHTCAVFLLTERGEREYRQAIEAIYTAAARDCNLSRAEVRMGGVPVENRAVDLEGEWTLVRLASVSAIVALLLAWSFIRNWKLIACLFFVSLTAALASLALVWFSGGYIDAFQLTMPSVVYVLTLSGAIHLVNYYRDALQEEDHNHAASVAITRGWLPCSLAAGTTSLGLISLTTSDLHSVRFFGIYTAAGVMGSLLLLFGFLPAAMQRWCSSVRYDDGNTAKWLSHGRDWFANVVARCHGWISVIAISLLLVSAVGLLRVDTSLKILTFFSEESRIIDDYRWLEDRLGPLVPMEVVIEIDTQRNKLNFASRLELVGRVHQSIAQLPEVGGVISMSSFLPRPPKRWLARAIYSGKITRQKHELGQTGYLSQEGDGARELWRISARLWALNDLDYNDFVTQIRSRVEPVLAAERRRGVDGLSATYTGVVPLICDSQQKLLDGLVSSLCLAFVLIGAVMMVMLRSVSAGLLAMIPNLFPVVLIFGCMGWMGVLVDTGSMITATVAMGVSVDDTIHLLTWYYRGLNDGLDRRRAMLHAYRACGLALVQTTAVGGVGLLIFAFSGFVPTRQFGLLMFLLMVAALVGDLLLLPALMVGPLGTFLGPGGKKSKA